MIFWTIAARNLARNRRRSLLTAGTIAVGLAGAIFLWGFTDGTNGQMLTNATRLLTGDLQIQGRGYLDDMSFDRFLEDGAAVEALLRDDRVERVARRIVFPLLVAGRETSRGVLAMGIDPAAEPGVTTLHRTVARGRYLAAGDVRSVVLGQDLADSLGVQPGDELVLLSPTAYGTLGSMRAAVAGTLRTGTREVDLGLLLLPLAAMQDLLEVESRASTYALTVKRQADLPALVRRLEAGLGDRVELLTWRRLLPALEGEIRFHEGLAYFVLIVVFLVVGAGIVNTVFMGVWERGREFGIMQALGTTRAQIVRVVAYESVLLAMAGSAAGALGGLAVTAYYGYRGIDLSAYAESMKAMAGLSPVVFPRLRADHVGLALGLVFLVGALAALYPAVMATRRDPIEAIQQLRAPRSARRAAGLRPRGRPIRRWVFVAMGVRSLFRNPRRSLITLSGAACAMAGIVFLWSFWEGYFGQMIDDATRFDVGHLQVSRPAFRREPTPEHAIREPGRVLAQVRQAPGVAAVAPRVVGPVLLTTGRRSASALLYGIDPAAEASVTDLPAAVTRGRLFAAGERSGIVLGRRLAERLGVTVNDKLVVYAQAAGGELSGGAYRVIGLLETRVSRLDDTHALLPLTAARELLRLDQAVSAFVIRLSDRRQVDAATRALRAVLPRDLEVAPWPTLLPIVTQTIDLTDAMMWIVLVVVFAVVAIGVMNTILVSTLERTREIGIMLAVGTGRGQVVRQVLTESCVLALAGVAVGALLGGAVTLAAALRGIDLAALVPGPTLLGVSTVVRPAIAPVTVAATALWLSGISLVVSVYPAWRVSRLDPVDAIARG